ncbi:hypothetical protein CERZMDRAFT_94741 [Cercospora zeae-maydis SCOH1-5]|uniref:Uncharacterized protein n=1 Tax=Cercospora zeae-maydis SCOH1-5 TaxID=717836 RepID=A0A6A6FPD0_9PEZI|nr:hypothetical protein CERZMDRAFT_94741 [Cercospora zeae-maydis SCOH1-5]
MPFAEHLGTPLRLLRHCNASTTKAQPMLAQRQLRFYMMAASWHTISRRAKPGKRKEKQSKRDYLDVMTLPPKANSDAEWHNESTIPNEAISNICLAQLSSSRFRHAPDTPGGQMLSAYLTEAITAVDCLRTQMDIVRNPGSKFVKNLDQ